MLNNKGQSLILFVIVLPVLLVILVLVIDIGRVMALKQELNNISEIVLDYGLDNFNNDIDLNNNYLNDNDDIDNYNNTDNSDSLNNILNNNEISNNDLESELIELIKLNKNDIDIIDVRIENNKIYIDLSEKLDGVFSSLIDISVFDIKSFYVGYIDNNNKRIERVSG